MRGTYSKLAASCLAFATSLAAADPALAGSVGAPGPLIGAGAPALVVFGVGYWLIRRRRKA